MQAQTAEFNATEADWRAGYLTLVSDVSTTYFQILQFDEQIDQQSKTLARNKQILTTYQAMFQNGLIPKIRVMQQQAEINRLTKDLLELRRSRDISENALATLVGVPAGVFKVPAGRLQERVQLPAVPAGLPSQLLSRRRQSACASNFFLCARARRLFAAAHTQCHATCPAASPSLRVCVCVLFSFVVQYK